MDNVVSMPKMGITMTSAKIVEWKKVEGDAVSAGDPLYDIETEKSTITVESPFSGTLKEIVVAEGDEADCGATVAIIES
jgi:pyruvate/2-oxoglutarate dehydrogenase complex dihydrolipoamide acyltransferase (E2) component